MKFFAVVVLAALCATAVTAAPQTTPNFSFEEYGLSSVLDGISKKLREYWGNVQCIRDVIGKVVQESEFKNAWDETKAKLDNLVTVEWQKCKEIEDTVDQSKCKAAVVEKAVEAITTFFKKLVAESKWELVKEIKDKVIAECFGEQGVFFDVEGDLPEEFQASLPEQFECIVDAIGDVSKENGLEDLWSKTEPQVRNRINLWKQCPNAGNKFLVILCNLREGIATYKLVTEYIRLVAAEKPEVIQKFAQEIQQRCTGQTDAELMAQFLTDEESTETKNGYKGAEKLKCITEAINDAVKESDFNKVWEEYKKDLEKLQERIKACKSEPTHWESAKCIAKEVANGREIVQKFLASLKNENNELYQRAKKYIKERCFA